MVTDVAAPVAVETAAAVEGEAGQLPQEVALLPGVKPGEEPAAAQPTPPADQTPAAAETGPVEAAKAATQEGEQAIPDGGQFQTAAQTPSIEPKKKSFLSAFFSAPQAKATPAPLAAAMVPPSPAPIPDTPKPAPETKPLITLASAEPAQKPLVDIDRSDADGEALPGVRTTSLFEIRHKSGIDDDSDVDLYEGEGGASLQLASAAGLARLAPNGLLKQRESVDVACLKPALVRMLKTVERHFGKKMIVTSGYRSPAYNRKVRGAKRSQHMYCAAADVQVPGVSKWELAQFVRAMPGRGGVGTYCHTESVHIDVGPERDWNWKCRRRKT